MPETSGWPAAAFANPIGSLMFSENIWQRLSSLIHLTWQNLAIWPLPCSVSILKTHFEKCQHSRLESVNRKVERHTHTHKTNQIRGARAFSWRVLVLTPQPQVTQIAGSFALFNVSLTLHTLGVIGTSGLLISAALMQGRKTAGSIDWELHPSLPFKAEKWHSLDCRRWPGWLPM